MRAGLHQMMTAPTVTAPTSTQCYNYQPVLNPDGTPQSGVNLACRHCGAAFMAHPPLPHNRTNSDIISQPHSQVILFNIPAGHGQPLMLGIGWLDSEEFCLFVGDFNGMGVGHALLNRSGQQGQVQMLVADEDILLRQDRPPVPATYVGESLIPDPRRVPVLWPGQGVVILSADDDDLCTVVRDPTDPRWDQRGTFDSLIGWPNEGGHLLRITDVPHNRLVRHNNWRETAMAVDR